MAITAIATAALAIEFAEATAVTAGELALAFAIEVPRALAQPMAT